MIINNVAHLRTPAEPFGGYKATVETPDLVLSEIKSKKDEIREFIKQGIAYMEKSHILGITANQQHSKLPIIIITHKNEYLPMINPYLIYWKKKMLASVEELEELPMVRCFVPRSASIRIKYFTLKENKFVIGEERFNGNVSANVQRLLDLLSGVVCFDKSLTNTNYKDLQNEGFIYRVKSQTYRADYFVDGINKLLFSGLTINPNDYPDKKIVGVSKIKKQ